MAVTVGAVERRDAYATRSVVARSRGFRFSSACAIAGSAAVVEDALEDRRLAVCLDGGGGASLAEVGMTWHIRSWYLNY